MNTILSLLPLFVAVANRRSFTKAAEDLEMPLPTVSRRIAALEKELGVMLFHRSTRKVALTASGKTYYERCRAILEDVDNAAEELRKDEQSPSGRIRLSVPADVYYLFMRPVPGNFLEQYPDIQLKIHFAARRVDLHTDPYDLDIRWGDQPDADFRFRRLITLQLGIYASPGLLERCPPPETLEEAVRLPVIFMTQHGGRKLTMSANGRTETVDLKPTHVVNSMGLSLDLALAGKGIAPLPIPIGREREKSGDLVRLLPDWEAQGMNINLVTPPTPPARRIRLFIDCLTEYFASRWGAE